MTNESGPESRPFARRRFLARSGAVAAATGAAWLAYDNAESFCRAEVFVARADSYELDLESILSGGLSELGIDKQQIAGKSVLLKPNLVEPTAVSPHINTHPNVIRAAIAVFRRLGAGEVIVAEGQGHVRDSVLVLEESGLGPILDELGVEFVDLNHDDAEPVPNRLRLTALDRLYLPTTILRRADYIVSMPKLKTHHWAGVTLSLKNLFGVMPGVCYGWPKNLLHHQGIGQSILDILAAVRPNLAIVDGIIGMEGDGPIMGTPKSAGVLVMGTNFAAVDATSARLMGIEPQQIDYLSYASGRFGPINANHIRQCGERIEGLVRKFQFLEHPQFDRFRSASG